MALASIALKNLRRQKKRSFLLGGAIAFGVLIVTIIDGFAGAFMQNVSENFANIAAGHIFVSGREKTASGKTLSVIRDDSVLMEVLEKTGIPAKYISKRSTARGTLIFESRKTQTVVQGVDFSRETYLRDRLVPLRGSFDAMSDRQGLILSEPTARKLNVEIGDRLLFQLTTLTGQQNVGEMVLAAISPDNGLLSGFSAYANLSYMNELLDMGSAEYQNFGIYLPSLAGMDRYADEFAAELARAHVKERKKAEAADEAGPAGAQVLRGAGEGDVGRRALQRLHAQRHARLGQADRQRPQRRLPRRAAGPVPDHHGGHPEHLPHDHVREDPRDRNHARPRHAAAAGAEPLPPGGAVPGPRGTGVGIAAASLVMAVLSLFNLGLNSPIFMLLRNGHLSFKVPLAQAVGNVAIIAALTLLAAWLPARSAARLLPAQALRTTK